MMKAGGPGEKARLITGACRNSFPRNDTSGVCQSASAAQSGTLRCCYFWSARGCGDARSACARLISACVPGWLHFLLPPALFVAVGAVGCEISPLISKQRGAEEAECGVLVPYGHGLRDAMGGQEILGAFWRAPAQRPVIDLNPGSVTLAIITQEAIYLLFGIYGKNQRLCR